MLIRSHSLRFTTLMKSVQHAALTMAEAMFIQFAILRQAMGLQPAAAPPIPDDHQYTTFEYRVPLQMETVSVRAVTLSPADLVTPPGPSLNPSLREQAFHCPFCRGFKRGWTQIPNYWSHIKLQHEEIPRADRLTEIKNSTTEYLEWVQSRGYNYSQSNPLIWQMMLQTQVDTFDWHTFEGWTLHSDRHHEAKKCRKSAR